MSIIYPVPDKLKSNSLLNRQQYLEEYKRSVSEPEKFWAEKARSHLSFFKEWDRVFSFDFKNADIRWFEGAKLNVAYNCIDRHLPKKSAQTAILWQGNEPEEVRKISYQELHGEVCRLANGLLRLGVKKGDRVVIYMPMIPEAAYSMLACARIGAVHSVVFAGFSAESLSGRITDSGAEVIITANQAVRGPKVIDLKSIVDKSLESCPAVKKVLVYRRTEKDCVMLEGRDVDAKELLQNQPAECAPAEMDAEDPLFTLYTSGSTGKPKGLLHTQAGYLLFAGFTHKLIFDYKDGDTYCCAADIGWITGHSYIVYGPLSNGATTVMFESTPLYPDAGRYWQMIEKFKINSFYTAPTALRALAKEDSSFTEKYDLSSLKVLGTVGEPINPATWEWYYKHIGKEKCAVTDTWWQTETGGIMIAPLPGATDMKPGSATLPLPGIQPVLIDADGKVIDSIEAEGHLCIATSWPGQARTIYGDHQRFIDTYFSTHKGFYFTGDGARRDSDGYYWLTGRVDDVINVAGHRIGTAEVESALVGSGVVAEAAAVGFPHDIKGTAICVFCVPKGEGDISDKALSAVVQSIGAFARPDKICVVEGLPKTRSGKIMRRILRKIAEGQLDQLGDISTLAEPEVVKSIIDKFR